MLAREVPLAAVMLLRLRVRDWRVELATRPFSSVIRPSSEIMLSLRLRMVRHELVAKPSDKALTPGPAVRLLTEQRKGKGREGNGERCVCACVLVAGNRGLMTYWTSRWTAERETSPAPSRLPPDQRFPCGWLSGERRREKVSSRSKHTGPEAQATGTAIKHRH